MAPRRKRGSAQGCDVAEPPTKIFGLPKEQLSVANVLDGPTLERFFVSSPRGSARCEATIHSMKSNDAAPSMCSASVVSLDDDRVSIDIDRDAAGAEVQSEVVNATPSTPPNTPLGLTNAQMVAARATVEREVEDGQDGATAADVVTAVVQGKLDGIVNGVLSGEPLSEKNYDTYMQFLLNTTAVGVEGRPDGKVTEANPGTKGQPLSTKEEQRESAVRQILETGEFPCAVVHGQPLPRVPCSRLADGSRICVLRLRQGTARVPHEVVQGATCGACASAKSLARCPMVQDGHQPLPLPPVRQHGRGVGRLGGAPRPSKGPCRPRQCVVAWAAHGPRSTPKVDSWSSRDWAKAGRRYPRKAGASTST